MANASSASIHENEKGMLFLLLSLAYLRILQAPRISQPLGSLALEVSCGSE